MSTQESDGIDEALHGVTQTAMTAAARIGEQLARTREQQAREAQARSAQAASEYGARFTAERDAARSSLAPVHRPEWWDSAQAEDVTKAYQSAKAWSDVDPEAVRAEQKIVEEVRNRFGVDVTGDSDPATVAEAVARSEQARADGAELRTGAGSDTAEAVDLMAGADAADRRAEMEAEQQHHAGDRWEDDRSAKHAGEADRDERSAEALHGDAGHAYDSAERREAMAEGMDHIENKAAVEARVRSDVAQGRPATEATTTAPSRAPKARATRGTPQTARTAQRTGRSR